MKKIIKLLIALVVLAALAFCLWKYMISAVSKNKKEVEFYVEEGDTYSNIGSKLKEEGLIRNELVYKIYIKINNPTTLELGSYTLDKSYDLKEILRVFSLGSNSKRETISITFKEGIGIKEYKELLNENFGFTSDDIDSVLNDSEYLDKLINKYWFLTDEINNDKLYYSLEGYLYPDTYEFYKDASIEDIFNTMIDNFSKKVSNYEKTFSSRYTFHETLTLASIIEQEAGTSDDRKTVASVFYNRLNDGWSLGSDVTTYYAEKLSMYERDLYKSELNECNDYNTRATCMAGKLPVGPICNPSIESIEAAILPSDSNYYYFVADKNGKTYFSKTNSEHNNTVNKLKREGLWYEY